MSKLILKIRTKNGDHRLDTLTTNNQIKDLKLHLTKLSGIESNRLCVLSGFPPKTLDITRNDQVLSEAGVTTGDTLILEERSAPIVEDYRPHVPDASGCQGVLMKRIVPADNSCLFSSLYFVLNGQLDASGAMAPMMRSLIAETIAKDPERFSDAILGKPVDEYCAWIQDDKSWGGAIELAILSDYYGIEIVVINTISANMSRFGEDQHYGNRVLLLFDGIHYDPLYLEPYDGSAIQTLFPTEDELILHEAELLGKEAQSSRQFTDVNKFTLKCMDCNIFLNGQIEAQEHAKSTGHQNFGEV